MSIKIEHLFNAPAVTIGANQIPVGTVFYSYIHESYKGALFLRTYNSIVSLSNPEHTWQNMNDLSVHEYQPVDITIKVEKVV